MVPDGVAKGPEVLCCGHAATLAPATGGRIAQMCSPVRCRTCGKITWAGCGDHVDQVRAMVPPELWCPGHEGEDPAQHRYA